MAETRDVSVGRLILVPSLITLAVTLIRLVGERQGWSPILFSRAAGGAGAIVGIVWLVPVFGVYFARRLSRAGQAPSNRGRAVLMALAGVVSFVALAAIAFSVVKAQAAQLVAGAVVSVIGAGIAMRAWPALGKVLLAYGFAARIPVVIVMLLAISGHWGTHYDVTPPNFPEMSAVATWFWIGVMPQVFFWIAFTILVGMLLGTLAELMVPARQD